MLNQGERPKNLYEGFREKLTAMAGECSRVRRAEDIAAFLIPFFRENKIRTVGLAESPLTRAGGLRERLQGAGIKVTTDNIRQAAPGVEAGITQLKWGIAELGTLVQIGTNVDQRLLSMLPPLHVALAQTSELVPTVAEALRLIHSLPEIPGFVGFITGPSRTADIERVLTIGVHGPGRFLALLVDEDVREGE
ncbi:5-formyltetrahydrofolate cyclo-ligase-like domain protein [Acididesulfobacillus acetoxydans]|uniref:5-formyltetrahydrofolate cyclo-ligase-like domain protein n=1 Tax=Acididesulfobacillus acetoxydans TaxID=1561005 RepID=A0A8S0W2U0_9FIRM|nr:lactate utilization protein [Acididesulfobacillus acetoxydans]CAA7600998.1 5-formyltetrahydrofolate cyclo-ligase-like domain protein [Acididesulfobacillus acetoxydans]CEJ07721.1 Lactate utilization protein B/C [Acididesulfobacillus acetoxydans]